MMWKESLFNQVENSTADEVVITVTELSMAVSKLINIVKGRNKRLVILNRGERVAVIAPYPRAEEEQSGE